MGKMANNNKHYRRSIEPVIEPAEHMGVFNGNNMHNLNPIKIGHKNNRSMEGQQTINSVDNRTENNEGTEDWVYAQTY